MAQSFEIALAAGGTAGHINPALALADELRDRGHHVVFYGRPEKLEGTLVVAAGYELVAVNVRGFDRRRPWTLASSAARVLQARHALGTHFAHDGRPDIAIGFGAYVEVPLLSWCRHAGVPYLIHEQNSVPGLANRMMASHAERVCISVPAAAAAFEHKEPHTQNQVSGAGDKHDSRIVLTGNPVRASVVNGSAQAGRAALAIPDSDTLLLVFGGSLGAKTINNALVRLKDKLLERKNLSIVHATGADSYEATSKALALTPEQQKRWHVTYYIDNMGDMLAAADVVLSRAGASSIAEIAAVGVPALLVPYPFATADHQTTNAHALTDRGAAVALSDDEVATPKFSRELFGLIDDKKRRQTMHTAALGLGQAHAATRLADEVEAVAHHTA